MVCGFTEFDLLRQGTVVGFCDDHYELLEISRSPAGEDPVPLIAVRTGV